MLSLAILVLMRQKECHLGPAAKSLLQFIPLIHSYAAEVLTGHKISPQLHELPIVEDVAPCSCISILDGLLIYLGIFWLKLH